MSAWRFLAERGGAASPSAERTALRPKVLTVRGTSSIFRSQERLRVPLVDRPACCRGGSPHMGGCGCSGRREVRMPYVDGFVLAVPKDRLPEYEALARKAGEVWREYGALSYVECVAEDVPEGKLTSFPMAVK